MIWCSWPLLGGNPLGSSNTLEKFSSSFCIGESIGSCMKANPQGLIWRSRPLVALFWNFLVPSIIEVVALRPYNQICFFIQYKPHKQLLEIPAYDSQGTQPLSAQHYATAT